MIRSSHSLRRLLYPVRTSHMSTYQAPSTDTTQEVTEDMASIGLKPLLVVHPYNHIINSVVIAVVESPCGCGPLMSVTLGTDIADPCTEI